MKSLPEPILQDVDITQYNTMGVSARAQYFAEVLSVSELEDVLAFCAHKKLPLYILGGGSNVLFVEDYEGMIIHMNVKGWSIEKENGNDLLLKVGAGENWHQLVLACVEKGWGGIENLSLIPGSVGAAPIQNIGAYGAELGNVFFSLDAVEIASGKIRTFTKHDCKFGYRDSVFKNELKGKYVITSVTLQLQKDPEINTTYRALSEALDKKGINAPTIKDVSDTVIEIRQSKLPDPAKIGNTGSFFKNPVITSKSFQALQEKYPDVPHYPAGKQVKVPAAWLIDQCGWKGKRFGDAGVHKMQALVIVNYGNATGNEIWALAQKIQASVKDAFGIFLTPEVNVVG